MSTLRLLAVAVIALSVGSFARAQPAPAAPATVAFPAAKIDGSVSVEKALKLRRSVRTLSANPITLEQLGQLCWATQGVTDEKGHRAAPSALATYPLELRVMVGNVTGVAPGIYKYRPDKHDLSLLVPGDKRAEFVEKAIGQGWISKAPAILILTGVLERIAPKAKERAAQFMATEAGLAAQGFFLEETALGLGSTFVGGFKPDVSRTFLALPQGEETLAVLPVGHKQ